MDRGEQKGEPGVDDHPTAEVLPRPGQGGSGPHPEAVALGQLRLSSWVQGQPAPRTPCHGAKAKRLSFGPQLESVADLDQLGRE